MRITILKNLSAYISGVALLILFAWSNQAHSAATHRTSAVFTMTIVSDPVLEILFINDVFEVDNSDQDDALFPSFTVNETSASYAPDTHVLTVNAHSNSRALFTGREEPSAGIAGGTARIEGALEVFNGSSDFGFFLDVRVHGQIEVEGALDHPSEYAEAFYRAEFVGNRLDGLPSLPMIDTTRHDTESPSTLNGYDFVTTTEILGVNETYSILIPPSIEYSGDVINLHFYRIGLFVQAGGAASSRFVDGSNFIIAEPVDSADRISIENVLPTSLYAAVNAHSEQNSSCIKFDDENELKVIIVGNKDLDVKNISLSSLQFAGLAVEQQKQPQCIVRDITSSKTDHGKKNRRDGINDLICDFSIDRAAWSPTDNIALLTGKLLDGTPLRGGDLVCRGKEFFRVNKTSGWLN